MQFKMSHSISSVPASQFPFTNKRRSRQCSAGSGGPCAQSYVDSDAGNTMSTCCFQMLEGAVVIQKEGFKATWPHVKLDAGECFKQYMKQESFRDPLVNKEQTEQVGGTCVRNWDRE